MWVLSGVGIGLGMESKTEIEKQTNLVNVDGKAAGFGIVAIAAVIVGYILWKRKKKR